MSTRFLETLLMKKGFYLTWIGICAVILSGGFSRHTGLPAEDITPNAFKGTDTERIRQAIAKAAGSTNTVRIPSANTNGTSVWMIDEAILLPSNIRIILDNCTMQLSDQSRDNMFRSSNVGEGITDPRWNENIKIIGIGSVVLKGAANPRSTGDGGRTLTQDPKKEQDNGNWRVSYGSDAGKAGQRQKGDWRNILILIAKVKGFELSNIRVENSHAWAISFERTWNATLSDIRIHNPEDILIGGRKVRTYNKDGINLRQGCKYFRIDNVTGINGDDLIALSSLNVAPALTGSNGNITSTMVTSSIWSGPEDDTEQVFITNCQTNYTGVAIRAGDSASIHHVYVNGIVTKARPDTPPPYGGSPYTLLVGGKGYGDPSQKGKINNIYAMNLMGDGKNLVLIEAPVTDCYFMNGIYTGNAPGAITYGVPAETLHNVSATNLVKGR